jgi:ZIP family zinc transporter
MPVAAFVVAAAAFISAFLGGFLALRAVRHVGMIIAIGAGIRIGAAFFDLIPEAVGLLDGSLDQVMVATAFGFLAFYAVEKLTAVHVGHEAAAELDHGEAAHRHVGVIGASGMSIHSFLDGVALATGLVVGGGLGLVIAVVVVIHRFSDGISVVSLLMANRTPHRDAYRWVAIVAVAPVLGILLGLVVSFPDQALGVLLAIFAGFFLYVGAAELLPEAHRSDRSRWVVVGTLGGVVAIYVFSVWAGAIA